MFCPTDVELADFLRGRLAPARWDALEQHLDVCTRCLARIAEAPVDRQLLGAFCAPPIPGKEPPPELIDRLEQLYTLGTTGEFGGDARPEVPERADPPARVAHYRISHQLGAGGMGVVYRAEDTHLRRAVALKVLWPRAARDPRARKRFLREARAVAALKHDHIVTIFQVGEAPITEGSGTHLFLAMELLEGTGLDRWMLRNPRPPLAAALRIVREAAAGLTAAHDRGVVHRDVKPANLWLEFRPRRGQTAGANPAALPPDTRVKLLDFGLATGADEVDGSEPLMGTPAYMAPEQVQRAAADARTDVFGLGCVLYELCTGTRPFPGRDRRNLEYVVPAPPHVLNPDIPPALEDLVTRMLAENPAARPASAELEPALAAIERALTGGTTETLAPANTVVIPRARATGRRWRVAAALGVAAVVGLGLWAAPLPPAEPAPPANAPDSETELVGEVIAQLKALNPGFDGSAEVQMAGGKVVSFNLPAEVVSDIGPVRALPHLRWFKAVGKHRGSGRITDLSPLKGKPLERIECWHNPGIRDFGPLRGMPLTHLDADGVGVDALDDLVGMPLAVLAIDRSGVRDLSPIRTMPQLRELRFIRCDVADFAPLLDVPLTSVRCDVRPGSTEAVLRGHPTLQSINGHTRDAFWDLYRARVTSPDHWFPGDLYQAK